MLNKRAEPRNRAGLEAGCRACRPQYLHLCEAARNDLLISQAIERVGPWEKMSFCLETDVSRTAFSLPRSFPEKLPLEESAKLWFGLCQETQV